MPIYEFKNTDSGEVFEKNMTFSDKEQYLSENENIKSHFSKFPGLCDPVRLGITKPNEGWKEVLQKINERTPGATLKDHSNLTRL